MPKTGQMYMKWWVEPPGKWHKGHGGMSGCYGMFVMSMVDVPLSSLGCGVWMEMASCC